MSHRPAATLPVQDEPDSTSTDAESEAEAERPARVVREGNHASFGKGIAKVLEERQGAIMDIDEEAEAMLGAYLEDVLVRLGESASKFARLNEKSVIGSREVATAVRLQFGRRTTKGAMEKGEQAVKKYRSDESAE